MSIRCIGPSFDETYGRPCSGERPAVRAPAFPWGWACGRARRPLRGLGVDGLGRVLDRADQGQDVSGVALDPGDLAEEDVEAPVRAGETAAEPGGVLVPL